MTGRTESDDYTNESPVTGRTKERRIDRQKKVYVRTRVTHLDSLQAFVWFGKSLAKIMPWSETQPYGTMRRVRTVCCASEMTRT